MAQRVKNILISQPEPADGRSPYQELRDKYNVNLSFRQFIKVEPVLAREFRRDKIDILDHTAIILSSRIAIEHLFRICSEMRIELPPQMKYFCVTESVALYLQKFIVYRKRKVFYPKEDKTLYDLILKHKNEKYLFPRSNISVNEVREFVDKHKLNCEEAVLYKTVSNDLTDLRGTDFDIIAFFSPSGIKSLFENFPGFDQQKTNTRIAAFGANTCQAVREAGLRLDIEAPTSEAPSMTMALEQYIQKVNSEAQ